MDVSLFAGKIVHLLGGQENIRELTYCSKSILFRVEDNKRVQERMIASLEVCKSFNQQENEFLLVPAISGSKLFKAILIAGSFGGMEDMKDAKRQEAIGYIGGQIASVVQPVLPFLLVNCSITILILFLSGLRLTGQAAFLRYTLGMLNGELYLLLPFLIGISASKQRKHSPIVGIILVAALLYPAMEAMEVSIVQLIKNPYVLIGMQLAILPVLLAVYLYDRFYTWLKEVKSLRQVGAILPMLSLLVVIIIIEYILYPAGAMVDRLFSVGILCIFVIVPPLGSAILGLLTPLLLMSGLLYGNFPVTVSLQQIDQTGFLIGPGYIAACICQGSAAIYMAVYERNKRWRRQELLCGGLAFLGFMAPVVLACNTRYRNALGAGMFGACACGIYFGVFHVDHLTYSLSLMIGLILGVVVTIGSLLFLERKREEETFAIPTRQGTLTNYPQKYRIK